MISNTALGIFLMGFAWAAQAACPTAPGRFVTNGALVNDIQADLVWKRCSEGQNWSGSACTGSASFHTHEQALVLAKASAGWRLPSVKELSSLADKGCVANTMDSAFPNMPSLVHAPWYVYYWSSSPYTGNAAYAWGVTFASGTVGVHLRSNGNAVRLVRSRQ